MISGEIKEGVSTETFKMKSKYSQFVGIFDFNKEERRKGLGIINDYGKEYLVEYDENGKEITEKRRRTFEGVRLMIIGNRFLLLLYYFFIFFIFCLLYYFFFVLFIIFYFSFFIFYYLFIIIYLLVFFYYLFIIIFYFI